MLVWDLGEVNQNLPNFGSPGNRRFLGVKNNTSFWNHSKDLFSGLNVDFFGEFCWDGKNW